MEQTAFSIAKYARKAASGKFSVLKLFIVYTNHIFVLVDDTD